MSDKLYNELYPKLNSLIGIKSNYECFYKSWWNKKCQTYAYDNLSDYYDIFFSRFVIYNSLYNIIVYTKERFGLLEKKLSKKKKVMERRDREKATVEIKKQFDLEDIELFVTNPATLENFSNIISIIDSKKFTITYNGGQPAPQEDELLSKKLKGDDKKEKLSGFLELLYNVRCNLFHGNKDYETDQIQLLNPLNEILYSLVEIIYNSYNKMINRLISETEQEIKLIEDLLPPVTLSVQYNKE